MSTGYCSRYDNNEELCKKEDRCYFYKAKEGGGGGGVNPGGDKSDGAEKKPEKKTIKAPGVVVTQIISADFTDTRNREKKRQYEDAFLRHSMAEAGSFAEYKRVKIGIGGRRLVGNHDGGDHSHDKKGGTFYFGWCQKSIPPL